MFLVKLHGWGGSIVVSGITLRRTLIELMFKRNELYPRSKGLQRLWSSEISNFLVNSSQLTPEASEKMLVFHYTV